MPDLLSPMSRGALRIESSDPRVHALLDHYQKAQVDAKRVRELEGERSATVAILRQVCTSHGDNDWRDNLHLADVIEKHLWPTLEVRVRALEAERLVGLERQPPVANEQGPGKVIIGDTSDGMVAIQFENPEWWIRFTPGEALTVAEKLLRSARNAMQAEDDLDGIQVISMADLEPADLHHLVATAVEVQ